MYGFAATARPRTHSTCKAIAARAASCRKTRSRASPRRCRSASRRSSSTSAMTRDGVLVVSHDRDLNPDHTRGPDGTFLDARGPADPLADARRAASATMSAASSPAPPMPQAFPRAAARSTAHAFRRWPRCSSWSAQPSADHVRFNIETKITPTSGADDRRSGRRSPPLVVAAVREAGLGRARHRAVVRLAHADGDAAASRPTSSASASPSRRRTRDTHPARRARAVALDRRARHRRFRRLGAAAGQGRGLRHLVAALPQPDDRDARTKRKSLGLKVMPWTVNERADMERLIDAGRRRHHHRLSRPAARRDGGEGHAAAAASAAALGDCRPASIGPALRLRPPLSRLTRMELPYGATPYDTDLDRNPANFQPLTPLTFLERAASVFPDQLAIVHGPLRRSYREFYARARQLASALTQARHRARRHGVGGARQHAGDARMPLRRADGGRGAQHHQHAARCRRHRVPARPRRGQGADHRPRVLQGGEGGAGAAPR